MVFSLIFIPFWSKISDLVDGEQILPIFEILTPKDLAILLMTLAFEGLAVNKIW